MELNDRLTYAVGRSFTAFVELAWINFRDAQMKALHPHLDEVGSVYPMCWSLQMAELTVQRTEMLKKMLDSEKDEGDVCAWPK